ncbi:hypothetical protein SFC50_25685 [Bacillus infantis]|uniref:hypothetical protein n=1 Tax=Bacillus infantis TaxID=324767 RepID=UPI003982D401
MNPIDELKEIVKTQKSISTARLEFIVLKFEKMYIQQGQKINAQKKSAAEINAKYQREKARADRRDDMVQQLENLKLHHRNLTREYNLLLEKYQKENKRQKNL